MIASSPSLDPSQSEARPFVDPRIKPLLDHVASELAREYVHLMETAAAAETTRLEEDTDIH